MKMENNNNCKWTYLENEEYDYYDTECGERFRIDNEHDLKEWHIKYCPFCGKTIEVK